MTLSAIGLFGKIPSQGDFLRLNTGEFSTLELDQFFQEAHELVHTSGGRLPDEPVHFVLAPRAGTRLCLGALQNSRDAVGRSFPLIAFAFADAATEAPAFPWLSLSHAAFFAIAADILATAQNAPAAELLALLSATPPLDPHPVDRQQILSTEPLSVLAAALGVDSQGAAYAFRTLRLACEAARNQSKGAGPTLGAPVPTVGARGLWLELVGQQLGRGGLPSLLWTEASQRLLITLGTPSPAAFSFLANPATRSSRYWPLRTESGPALAEAYVGLSQLGRQVIESPQSSLWDAFAVFGQRVS